MPIVIVLPFPLFGYFLRISDAGFYSEMLLKSQMTNQNTVDTA